jgi:hypothetical protein
MAPAAVDFATATRAKGLRIWVTRAFFDSKVVSHEDVAQLIRFPREIAIKIAKRSKSALQELAKEMNKASPSVESAINLLDYQIEDLPPDRYPAEFFPPPGAQKNALGLSPIIVANSTLVWVNGAR